MIQIVSAAHENWVSKKYEANEESSGLHNHIRRNEKRSQNHRKQDSRQSKTSCMLGERRGRRQRAMSEVNI